jgi:hypothetical protein
MSLIAVVVREGPSTLRHPLRRFSLPQNLGRHPFGWRWFAYEDRAIAYLWRFTFFVCLVCLVVLGALWIALQI